MTSTEQTNESIISDNIKLYENINFVMTIWPTELIFGMMWQFGDF